jgi:peptidoglycan L-alanyl-D-glutamate endopeptidase CwlK
MSTFSQRSKDALVGVAPPLVRLMEAAIADTPVDFTIVEGLRSLETQKKYYTWGRTVVNPNTGKLPGLPFGKINTKRDGVKLRSEHQAKADGKGHAVDIVPFSRDKNGKGFLDWDNEAAYKKLAAHIKAKAAALNTPISWGGDWQGNLYDTPHFELK